METKEAAKFFECLSSTVRLEIFRLLTRFGSEGLVAGQISAELDIPANNLSFHLKAMMHCGLITTEQEGRFVRCKANLEVMRSLSSYLVEACCTVKGHC